MAVTYGEQRGARLLSVTDAVDHLLAGTIPPADDAGHGRRPAEVTNTAHHDADHHARHDADHRASERDGRAAARARRNGSSDQADQALANQDLATFAEDIKQVQALLKQANALAVQTATTTPPSSSTTTTPPTSTPTSGSARLKVTTTTARVHALRESGFSGNRGPGRSRARDCRGVPGLLLSG